MYNATHYVSLTLIEAYLETENTHTDTGSAHISLFVRPIDFKIRVRWHLLFSFKNGSKAKIRIILMDWIWTERTFIFYSSAMRSKGGPKRSRTTTSAVVHLSLSRPQSIDWIISFFFQSIPKAVRGSKYKTNEKKKLWKNDALLKSCNTSLFLFVKIVWTTATTTMIELNRVDCHRAVWYAWRVSLEFSFVGCCCSRLNVARWLCVRHNQSKNHFCNNKRSNWNARIDNNK